MGTSHTWASAQTNPGRTRHGRPAERPRGQHLGARLRDAGPLASAPRSSPISSFPARRESNFPIGKTTVHADRPPAPHPAFESGRGVSSNLSPCHPRTPPPPPHPERETKGRARRVPPRGFHGGSGSQAGPPFGSPEKPPRGWEPGDKDTSPGEGPAGAGPWKALEKGRGAHHGRGRASPDPWRLRSPRAGRPGARAGGARREGPQGAASTPEGAPSAGAVRGAARTDHGGRGPSGLGGCHGPHGGLRAAPTEGRGRAAPGETGRAVPSAGDAPPERGRRGRTTAASRGASRPRCTDSWSVGGLCPALHISLETEAPA